MIRIACINSFKAERKKFRCALSPLPLFFASVLLISCQTVRRHDHTPLVCPVGFKDIALIPDLWKIEYSGFGKVDFSPNGELQMQPAAAQSEDVTHSVLVLSQFTLPKDSFDFEIEYKNLSPLRLPKSHPWEVFWVFFQYRNPTGHDMKTNYVVMKRNGMELGQASSNLTQKFLKTADYPKTNFGQWQTMRIKKIHSQIYVEVNGEPALEWLASTEEEGIVSAQGRVGLYTEDAAVTVRRFCLLYRSVQGNKSSDN